MIEASTVLSVFQLLALPPEIILHTIRFLNFRDAFTVASCSKSLYQLINGYSFGSETQTPSTRSLDLWNTLFDNIYKQFTKEMIDNYTYVDDDSGTFKYTYTEFQTYVMRKRNQCC